MALLVPGNRVPAGAPRVSAEMFAGAHTRPADVVARGMPRVDLDAAGFISP